ncbi:MAG: HAD family phosphatase [Bacteroidaceae bacterium]|nr:HAD family phosphatase [Bacteroidaceae bacterium]
MTILFDLDGVLLDTEPQYSRFWTQVGAELFPDRPDFPILVKGNTLRHIFDTWFADNEAAQTAMRQRLREHETQMTYPFLPGAETLLDELKSQGYETAIVTSSSKPKMAFVLREHPDLPARVSRIFTAEDAARSKPAPDCFLNAAKWFGRKPGECIVVEDSPNGLRAASAAGMRIVGLLTTTPRTVVEQFADLVVPDLSHLSVADLIGMARAH